MSMKTNEESRRCPNCNHKHSSAEEIGSLLRKRISSNAEPKGGDISICIRCAAVNVFNDDLSVRKATAEELQEFGRNVEVKQAISIIKKMRSELN